MPSVSSQFPTIFPPQNFWVGCLDNQGAPTLGGLSQAVVVSVVGSRQLSSPSLAGNPADSQGSPSAFPWRETPHSGITGLLNWLQHEFVIFRTHRQLPYLRDPSFLVSLCVLNTMLGLDTVVHQLGWVCSRFPSIA